MTGIYKITCIKNGKVYIGQAINLESRITNHKCRLKNNYHDNLHLQRAWNKYGSENFKFEIIEECGEDELDSRERYWINFYGYPNTSKTFNHESGGHSNKHLSDETKEKIRQGKMGELNPCYGKQYTKEERKRISDTLKSIPRSKNSLEAIRLSNLKRQVPVLQYTTDGKFIRRFDGIQIAARELGLQASLIHKVCNGIRNKTGGFIWRYEDDTFSE